MNTPVVHQHQPSEGGGLAVMSPGTGIADPKFVIAQVRAVQEIMKAVMKEGVHFGVIPGTDKPTLYKPGSEVLLSTFRIAVEPTVREIRDGNHIIYQVQCLGRHISSNLSVGIGIGEASTAEEKYAWRAAVCNEEYDATPEDRRREKWFKGKRGYQGAPDKPPYMQRQVRTNPADLANTVLKMAKKRGQMDLTLTALAASDIFSQDLEDLPAEYIEGQEGSDAPPRTTPNNRYQQKDRAGERQQSGGASGPATEGQVKMVRAKVESAGLKDAFFAEFKVADYPELPKAKVNEALEWLKGKTNG